MIFYKPIPVIDIFAGPGGLGEGFSTLLNASGSPVFELKVSAEKDPAAHQTLSLRALFRKFPQGKAPDCYYDHIRGEITRTDLFAHPQVKHAAEEACQEARNFELGRDDQEDLDDRISRGISGVDNWVLIGGPPCQAYSIAGRSRRTRESQEEFERDERHFLYQEYLRIIRRHKPAIFVMENVKGMLSSKHSGSPIFERIFSDLTLPGDGLEYEIRSLVKYGNAKGIAPQDFVIEAERFGIPQGRHRVILLGIRSDIAKRVTRNLKERDSNILREDISVATVGQAIGDLPPLRSRLSQEKDGHAEWMSALKEAVDRVRWFSKPGQLDDTILEMERATIKAQAHGSVGGPFTSITPGKSFASDRLRSWFADPRIGGVIQHETRRHMRSDLYRYLFASAYAKTQGVSPKVNDFPLPLLPNHENIFTESIPFADRFRVQTRNSWGSTLVSHIAKDGHHFIHYDPSQCRSLTVREAARIQTFPDNYFFCGTRTQQYTQVGNAVPPMLANQIAQLVSTIIAAGTGAQYPLQSQCHLSRPAELQEEEVG